MSNFLTKKIMALCHGDSVKCILVQVPYGTSSGIYKVDVHCL